MSQPRIFPWVESMEGIILRTSHLEPNVLVSPHSAPDVLGLRLCSCGDNRGSFREPLRGFLFSSSGGDKRPRTFTGKCFRAINPHQKFRLIDKIISRAKKYPVVVKKKGLANTTRPKSIICYPHSITTYSKNI
jgi:hypothetical protein